MEYDLRDQIVRFIEKWSGRTGMAVSRLCALAGVTRQRYHDWRGRMGTANRHARNAPHANWLEEWECRRIVEFYQEHFEDGYRRCAYMMMDADIVHVRPSTVYRVLCRFGVIRHWGRKPSRKGGGFEQPLLVHEHWHMDITYVHVRGRPYYMITVIDGCSRFIVSWELFATMEARDVGIVQQKALEAFPQAHPRFITDNGKQFVGKEFKEFIAMHGYTHVTTSVYYPQSNGKIERWHESFKSECVRRKCMTDLDHARLEIAAYIDFYNERRLHSAIGYVTPRARLEGRHVGIQAERDRKIEEARRRRKARFDIAENTSTVSGVDEAEAGSAGTQSAEE